MIRRPTGVLEPLPLMVLRAGQFAVRQGEPSPGRFTVEFGVLRVSSVDNEGRELVIDLAGPRDVVGGAAGDIAPWTVRSLGPARLRAAPLDAADPMADRLAGLVHLIAWHDVGTRVERRLQDLAARFGTPVPGGVAIGLHLTQAELAAMTGVTRESVSRALPGLVAAGRIAVVRRGRYVVRSPLRVVGSV